MRKDADRAVWELAGRQRGVITREQALAAGWSPGALRRRVEAGLLRKLYPRVYIVGPGGGAGTLERAALLAAGTGALLSHLTAAAQWGLVPQARGGPVHVMLVGTGRGRIRGLHTHRVQRLDPDERSRLAELHLTSPARTLVDVASLVGSKGLESMVARAERSGMLPPASWGPLLERYRGRPGVASLRAILSIPGGPAYTRSTAEDLFLELVRRSAFPAPQVNVSLESWEVDFLWWSERVVVEVDGYAFHRTRSDFERDRAKDAWLLARGFRVLRLSWRQITEESMVTVGLLAQALVGGGSQPRPLSRPPSREFLPGLGLGPERGSRERLATYSGRAGELPICAGTLHPSEST